jgi:hypothetical protein
LLIAKDAHRVSSSPSVSRCPDRSRDVALLNKNVAFTFLGFFLS